MDKNTSLRGTVLVTGGARRIGAAISRALAADGWRVLVHARRADDPDAVALAQELGGRAFFADFTESCVSTKLFDSICAVEPGISAIVNNAAVFSPDADLSPEDAAWMRVVNACVPKQLMHLLDMRLAYNADPSLPQRGAVVNMLDARILSETPEETPYVRSKLELLRIGRRFAVNSAKRLRVNAVAPGPVLCPENRHVKGGDILLASRPTPEDVGAAVAFLMSAPAITGAVLPVDAGQHLCGSEPD